MKKQVEKAHYRFSKYVHKRRWASMRHQMDEVLSLDPNGVLEIGLGPGVFKTLIALFGVNIQTLDIDPDLAPDHLGSVLEMSFEDRSFDVVCVFQMLEHLPYEQAIDVLREMERVSRSGVVISVPDTRPVWSYAFPVRGTASFGFTCRNRAWSQGSTYSTVSTTGRSTRQAIGSTAYYVTSRKPVV